MPVHLSGAQYAQKLLTDPDWYMPVLLDHVANVISSVALECSGLHIVTLVDIEGLPPSERSEVADVIIELNDRPETVQNLIDRFKSNELIHKVRPEEDAILIGVPRLGYGVAYIKRHSRLDCVRVQIG